MNASTPTTVLGEATLHYLPLECIVPSSTHIQSMRRARFDARGLQELADSFRDVGVLEPIVVRPLTESGTPAWPHHGVATTTFEIVAGERRFLAAKLAGLATMPATVRDLDDTRVLEIQLIENLQREGLHPLEEAEGYRELMRLKQINAEALGALLGKSRSHVYSRTKLLDLCPEARTAMGAGTLDASKGLLLARIPGAKLQKRALEMLERDGQWKSYRYLVMALRDKFMVALDTAPFALDDETLARPGELPAMHKAQVYPGPCITCPHNSANDPELQASLEADAHICTHVPCFEVKSAAHSSAQRVAAEAAGRVVITGDAARKILPTHWRTEGYIKLDDPVEDLIPPEGLSALELLEWEPPTWRAALGGHVQNAVLVESPHENGKLYEMLSILEARIASAAAGITLEKYALKERASNPAPYNSAQAQADRDKEVAKRQIETDFRAALLIAIHAKWKPPLKKDEWRAMAAALTDGYLGDQVAKLLYGDKLKIETLDETGLQRLCLEASLAEYIDSYGSAKPLVDMAVRLKIDAQAIKKELQAQARTAGKGKK